MLVIALAGIHTLLRSKVTQIDRLLRYFVFIGAIAVAAGLMIGYGRLEFEEGLRESLRTRYATWSLLCWTSVVGLTLVAAYQSSYRFGVRWAFGLYISLLLASVHYGNLKVVDSSLRYAYSYWMDTITQVTMNHTKRPTDRRLWRDREDVWLKIIDHLRTLERSIYAWPWPYRMGRDLSKTYNQISDQCISQLEVRPSNRRDEWLVRGWILPKSKLSTPLSTVSFLDETGHVIGFALPIFGSSYSESKRYFDHMILPARVVSSFGLRGLRDLPGISGHFLGRVLLSEANADEVRRQLAFFAETRRGGTCWGYA